MAKKFEEYGIYKNNAGYFKKEDIDRMLSGEPSPLIEAAKNENIKIPFFQPHIPGTTLMHGIFYN